MAGELAVSIGQYSDKGRKDKNQDFHGALIPVQPALGLKGIAVALADGISTSSVSHIAAESAIKGFLTDYYCTSDSWTVKTAAQRVIAATNAWLNAQTRTSQYVGDQDRGYVCTLSVLVLKSTTAHVFHVGDSRVYRLAGQSLEQLTTDHRISISSQQSYLSRALGVNPDIEIDYRVLPLEPGDIFVLATDGVHEFATARFMARAIAEHPGDLDAAARAIAGEALAKGSGDNLTVQIVRVDALPMADAGDVAGQGLDLPMPPLLAPRQEFDGYKIIRQIHASSRSHIYLALDTASNAAVALKIPSIDLRGDAAYIKRFLMEEWVARRLDSAFVLKAAPQTRPKNFVYTVTEFVDGQTLRQWMTDNPKPPLEAVRAIVEQIAKGLRAFHRREMLHQDLRPENIIIDATGTAKIIDFGSTYVAGAAEARPQTLGQGDILGTFQYTAPEYFLGQAGSTRSDLFSLGVIAYEMLTGKLPYGAGVARARTPAQMARLRYEPAASHRDDIPVWVDGALKRAVSLTASARYEALSELLHDLRTPNPAFLRPVPLIERNPLLFWQALVFLLVCSHFVMAYFLRK
jgi:serine/threonine protein phosphatase PrpC